MKPKIKSLCLFNEQIPKNNALMSTTTQNLSFSSSTIAFIWCFVQFIFFPFSVENFSSLISRETVTRKKKNSSCLLVFFPHFFSLSKTIFPFFRAVFRYEGKNKKKLYKIRTKICWKMRKKEALKSKKNVSKQILCSRKWHDLLRLLFDTILFSVC